MWFYILAFIVLLFLLLLRRASKQRGMMKNVVTNQSTPGSINPFRMIYFMMFEKKLPIGIELYHMTKKFSEPLVYYNLLGFPIVVVKEPKIIKEMLKENRVFEKMLAWRSVVMNFFGEDNVVFNNGDKWRTTRQIIQPVFGKISIFFGSMTMKVDQLIEIWEKKMVNGELVVGEDIKLFTLDVLGLCVFGKDFNFLGGNGGGPMESYSYIMKNGTKPLSLMPESIYKLIPFKSFKRLITECDNFNLYLNELIEEYQKSPHENEDKKTLLQQLIDANKDHKIHVSTIRDNAVIFFVAGHETTANALYFLLYSLASYPEAQEKLRIELNNAFPNEIIAEKLKDIGYLTNVIDETLRLYPPSGLLGTRIPTTDTIIDDWVLPKGYQYLINIYGLHRNKEVWGDDVDEFNPDRFNHLTKEQMGSYIPFGGGGRICLGMTFTLYEQKIFISTLIKKYRISLVPGSKLEYASDIMDPKTSVNTFKFESIN